MLNSAFPRLTATAANDCSRRLRATLLSTMKIFPLALSLSSLAATATNNAIADGTEALGAPDGIVIAEGTDVLLRGVGLFDGPAAIEMAIPESATIKQVIAYWEGASGTPSEQGETDEITLNGISVVGTRIGGPSNFWSDWSTMTYRADVTDLALVGNGPNVVAVDGLDFHYANSGLGLAVIVDDGAGDTEISIRDGNDYAYNGFSAPFDETERVTYEFEASDEDRDADLGVMVAGVMHGRPSTVSILIDGVYVEDLIDILGTTDGAEWDSIVHPLTIPAGTTSVSVEVWSYDVGTGQFAGGQEASLAWTFSSFAMSTPGEPEGCSPFFWQWNTDLWDDSVDDNATETVRYNDRFNERMHVSPWRSGMSNSMTLLDAIKGKSWGWIMRRFLNRHAAAALANADSDLNYPYTTDEVIGLYRDAVRIDPGPESIWTALVKLYSANWLACTL